MRARRPNPSVSRLPIPWKSRLAEDGYAYTNKVGDEDKIVIRQRRVSFPYDDAYSPTPLPRLAAVFHNFPRTTSKTVTDAIPDTGADVTCLPMDDCQDLDLFLFPFYTGVSHPFAGVRRSVTFDGPSRLTTVD